MRRTFLVACAAILGGCGRYEAAPPLSASSGADPPARVARASYTEGAVSFRTPDDDQWRAVERNHPLTSGDSIQTADGARAELHVGNAAFRMSGATALDLQEIGTSVIAVRLRSGTIAVRVREMEERDEVEVKTGDRTIALLRPGSYRIDYGEVAVRSGIAEIRGSGTTSIVRPPAAPGEGMRDAFDDFCADRDRREEKALSAKRVSPGMIGYDELDDAGDWSVDAAFGTVWTPRGVPSGWAPYRFGHWVWISPWGWTWVDDAPWGFAPFHYGRWIILRTRWHWVPGPYLRRPIYSPALVVFLGGGPPRRPARLRVGIGFGAAWFPLGPGERWQPPYRASRSYVANVNFRHTGRQTIHRANPGAVSATRDEPFRRGEPVHQRLERLEPREIERARPSRRAPPPARDRRPKKR